MPVRAAELMATDGDSRALGDGRRPGGGGPAGGGRAAGPASAGGSTPRCPGRTCADRRGGCRPGSPRSCGGRLDSGSLSARGFDRVIRMAWTIADLDGRDRPDQDDVREAIQLRTGEAT